MESAPEPKKPRGRWFRYSLRTVFIFVTLICCYLAWESGVVHERKAVRNEYNKRGIQFAEAQVVKNAPPVPPGAKPLAKVSLLRTWLGDKAIQEISYMFISDADRQRLESTFPEATLVHVPPMEPCHPGCFPAGTLVETPYGKRAIEGIAADEFVTTVLPSGELTETPVQSVFITDNRIWLVETDGGDLFTTETQPLCLSTERFVQAGKLEPGDEILLRHEGKNLPAKVRQVSFTGRTEKVYNLILGGSEVFISGGFLARSKPPAQVAAAR